MKKAIIILAVILAGGFAVWRASSKPAPQPAAQNDQTIKNNPVKVAAKEEGRNDIEKIKSGPILSFNFDDGLQSSYDKALPIFDKAGFKTTQYIITQAFGKPDYVTKDEVLKMYEEGHEIGAHTRTHAHLTMIPLDKAKEEIEGSKQDLMAMGITPVTFAYPYGQANVDVARLVRNAGFLGARITVPEFDDASVDPYLLRRQRVQADTKFEEIKSSIDRAIEEKKWLILVFHGTGGNNYEAVTPEMIQRIVDYVKQSGVPVVTNAGGLQILKNIR